MVTPHSTSRTSGQGKRPKVLLFGMPCGFTAPVLDALIASPAVDLVAVILSTFVQEQQGSLNDVLTQNDIPSIQLSQRMDLMSEEFHSRLLAIQPDIIVVACFPWRLPSWILNLSDRYCLNIHPSLLPDGHGPEPVFWAFRWGLKETGVTVHQMNSGFDTGPILAQQRVEIPADATIPSLEHTLASLGAMMLIEIINGVPNIAPFTSSNTPVPSRHARFPQKADMHVTTAWNVEHAARFIKAVAAVYGFVEVLILSTGQRLAVENVISVDHLSTIVAPTSQDRESSSIQFSGGVLRCRVRSSIQPIILSSKKH